MALTGRKVFASCRAASVNVPSFVSGLEDMKLSIHRYCSLRHVIHSNGKGNLSYAQEVVILVLRTV